MRFDDFSIGDPVSVKSKHGISLGHVTAVGMNCISVAISDENGNLSYRVVSDTDKEVTVTKVEPSGKNVEEIGSPDQGVKHDSNKLQWHYMWTFLPELEQVAYVLQYGDSKYPANDGANWKRLPNLERRASSAAMRHLSAYLKGEKIDGETNKSHLAHCITNLLFLMYNDRCSEQ